MTRTIKKISWDAVWIITYFLPEILWPLFKNNELFTAFKGLRPTNSESTPKPPRPKAPPSPPPSPTKSWTTTYDEIKNAHDYFNKLVLQVANKNHTDSEMGNTIYYRESDSAFGEFAGKSYRFNLYEIIKNLEILVPTGFQALFVFREVNGNEMKTFSEIELLQALKGIDRIPHTLNIDIPELESVKDGLISLDGITTSQLEIKYTKYVFVSCKRFED